MTRSRPPTVLLLDGDSKASYQAERTLLDAGYWVAATVDPLVALQRAREAETDLFLVDISMGAMEVVPGWERRKTDPAPAELPPLVQDGYAILREIEADPAAARYPAVLLRDFSGRIDRHGSSRFGVVGFVPKPFTPQSLRQKVQSVFRKLRLSSKLPAPPPSGEWGARTAPEDFGLSLDGDLLSGWGVPTQPFEALPKPLRKALVLDPDPGYRDFLRDLLEAQGFTVHDAAQRREALRLALERRPWLIITDIIMPEGEGFEFCRQLRSHSLISHTPLLFLSNWDGYRERYHASKLGADDYVSKRSPNRELLIRIQLILKRYSDLPTRTHRGAGMQGGIELIGAPGILQMCHLSQLSGILACRSGVREAEIAFRAGDILSAEVGRLRGAEAVHEFLSWSSGHFEFVIRDLGPGEPLAENFDGLLLEGCRRLDEERRDGAADETASQEPRPASSGSRRERQAPAYHVSPLALLAPSDWGPL